MIIRTNIPSLNATRNLNGVSGNQAKSSQRLSSGLRINSAADDAAGLAISEKMRAQIRGLNQAERNIQDGTSLLHVADGALQEAQDIIHRMRELAVQACNDTNTASDRVKLNEEYKNFCYELNDIAQNTEFNTKKLFTGEYAERIFSAVDIEWFGAVETDPPNNATSRLPDMPPLSNVGSQASIVTEPSISGAIPAFPPDSDTPQAELNNPPRPPRDLDGTANDLTGDQEFSSGIVNTNNIGGKIVYTGTNELNVGDNTSYKNNIDGSWNDWQWQQRDRLSWNAALGTYNYSAWRNIDIERVGTIEDHSINENDSTGAHDGGIAGAPPPRIPTDVYQYFLVGSYQPTTKLDSGNTQYDYDNDEWERAEIYSEAKITKVTNNNGGAVYVRNSDPDAETNIGNNNANMNYNLSGVSPPAPQARVDTDTKKVTVGKNSYCATVVSRNQTDGSTFTATTNERGSYTSNGTTCYAVGTIYSGAQITTVTTNNGALYVNSSGNADSIVKVTTNAGISTTPATLYANSYIAEIGSNSRYATIVHSNSAAGSSFDLATTNNGNIKTSAQNVTVNDNSTYGNLVTTNTDGTLTVTTNSGLAGWGAIATQASTVTIGANNGQLLIQNSAANATIGSTNANSRIDTYAQRLDIEGDANGSIRVENGATVNIGGNNNATLSILSGGTVTVDSHLGGTTTVESGATLTINGDITGTLYVKAGANVSFTGELKGKIVFLAGDHTNFSSQPFNVATTGIVELQSTTNIHIGQNIGTVNMFNSTANIADNKGTLRVSGSVNGTSTATVSANSGNILNLGNLVLNGSPNTGTIHNWNQLTPPYTNGSGNIYHHALFATDNDTYNVSGVKFPNVVAGELVPPGVPQISVVKLLYNSQEYELTAEWVRTAGSGDTDIMCDCVIGAHGKDGCTDHAEGLVADVFELKFDLDSVDPPLQDGEQFIFEPNTILNAAGMRYDIVGRTLIYDVDVEVTLTENWEDGNGLWLHTGANTDQGHTVYLPDMTHSMSDITINCAICDCSALESADLLTVPNATAALGVCDITNDNVSKVRGYLGSEMNRLMHSGNYVAISSENTSSAESRIRDADMAKEIMSNTKSNILAQVGMSLLAQSNQNPQMILQLLR